jgi:hypothetical protein
LRPFHDYELSGKRNCREKAGTPTFDLVNRTVRFKTRHFSFFTLAAPVAAASTLASFVVYPNPWMPNDVDALNGVEYQAGVANTGITFENLPQWSTIRIYTPLGVLVDEIVVDASGGAQWDVRNARCDRVASGVYVYLVISPSGERRTGKLVVIR